MQSPVQPKTDDDKSDGLPTYHAGALTGPKGHQYSVIEGAGKQNPGDAYGLCTAILCEEMLAFSTPSRW
jgi:hypothetical protein